MSAPDLVTAHVTAGIPNIGEFWPGLTEQDVHTMNAWRWSAHRHQGARDHAGSSVTKSPTPWWHRRGVRREEIVR